MLKFSFKNAFRKKSTAILASIGVAIGLMLVFVVGAYTAGVQVQFEDNLTRTLGIANVIEESEIGPNSQLPLNITESLINTEGVGDSILGYNVETQAPYSYTTDYLDKLENPGDRLAVVGLNKSLDEVWRGFTTRILEGRNFEIGQNETIISTPLASIAKREELVFVQGQEESIALDRQSPMLHLLQEIRDEAHRFAVTYHRKRRSARDFASELDSIPGIGEKRKKRLLQNFGSVAGVRRASVEELTPFVGGRLAERIKNSLRQ